MVSGGQFAYDLFFDEPPTADLLEKTLNALGLVCALMLSVLLGVPGSFSIGELEDANERFRAAYETGRCWYKPGKTEFDAYGGKYSDRLAFNYNLSTVLLSVALLLTVLVYVFLSTHDYAKDEVGFGIWWRRSRFIVAAIILTLLSGLFYTYLTFQLVFELKFPRQCTIKAGDVGTWSSGYVNGTSYWYLQLGAITASVFVALFVLSDATRLRYHASECASQVNDESSRGAELQEFPDCTKAA